MTKSIDNPCGFTDEEMNQLFRVKASPLFWRQKAEELKYASDILLRYANDRSDAMMKQINKKKVDLAKLPPSVYAQAFALLGFSLECLFKATIIRDNPDLTTNGKLSKLLWSHDLIKLAALAKIPLNADEQYACERLTDDMLKDFRYPINKEKETKSKNIQITSIPVLGAILYYRIHPTVNQIHPAKGGVVTYEKATAKPSSKWL
ncbi:MAG: hypothetical protein JNM51_09955, partial [Bacteroidia bacterium]|nr:hypothetical protein [Bacteroidia bacterium]